MVLCDSQLNPNPCAKKGQEEPKAAVRRVFPAGGRLFLFFRRQIWKKVI